MAMGLSSGRSGGRRRRRGRAPMSEINVTPFVDVMLVLLIIFMVTAPLLTSGVPIDLPDSRASTLPQEQDPITISVSPDGAMYFGDEFVSPDALPARLAEIRPNPDGTMPQINLRGDRALAYGQMMAVMGELNRAGLKSIALLTNSAASGENTGADAEPSSEAPTEAVVSDGSESGQ